MDNAFLPLPDERQAPLYFAGRRAELDALNVELNALGTTGKAPGGLRLVTGVPGVGKTQLAVKYMDSVAHTKVDGVEVHTLVLEPNGLKDETSLFRSICEGLGEAPAGDKIAQVGDRLSGGGAGIGIAGLRGRVSANVDVGRHTGDLGLLLRRSLAAGLWQKKALVVVVDELQRIDADGIDLLSVLHVNVHNCPMQLIGFGLQHTATVLANPGDGRSGISRVRPPLMLGSLSSEDAVDAIDGNLKALGHSAGTPKESVKALADASFGFPQHIHGYLQGADAALRRFGSLDGEALKAALRDGDESRRRYYEMRLAAVAGADRLLPLVGHMATSKQDAISQSEAKTIVGDDLVDAAVAHGVLSQSPKGDLSFAIPSFANYMRDWHSAVASKPPTQGPPPPRAA